MLPWPPRRSAEEFCDRCDFPLFWAPGARVDAMEATDDQNSICTRCAWANPGGSQYCNRCGSALRED